MTAEAPAEAFAARRWRALHPVVRLVLFAVAALVGLNLALAGLEAVTGGSAPGGPSSSSYATGPEGLAAYADLLGQHGHPVSRLRARLDRSRLDPGTTVLVADPTRVRPAETAALARFVRRGGRLLASGEGSGPALRRLLGPGLEWAPGGGSVARPVTPVPEVSGVSSVRADGPGSWRQAGPTLPVLEGREGATVATVASLGRGRIVALADPSLWQNRQLGSADNAALALAAAGEAGRPVRFAEAHHGFDAREGFDAIPPRWKWAMAAALLATLAWMWSQGRRLGPPEQLAPDLPPPRRAYVDALAASLARTRQPADAIEPLQATARRLVARRAGLPDDADADALRRAARRLGLAEAEVAALFVAATTTEDVMAAGRALAHLDGGAIQRVALQ